MHYPKGQNVMEASIVQNSSWVIKRVMEFRDEVQQYQMIWDKMLTQSKFKMSVLYAAMNDDANNDEEKTFL